MVLPVLVLTERPAVASHVTPATRLASLAAAVPATLKKQEESWLVLGIQIEQIILDIQISERGKENDSKPIAKHIFMKNIRETKIYVGVKVVGNLHLACYGCIRYPPRGAYGIYEFYIPVNFFRWDIQKAAHIVKKHQQE